MGESPDKISITICGDGGCDMTRLSVRVTTSSTSTSSRTSGPRTNNTIEDSYSVTRTIDGSPYFLSITDTAGQEEYRGLWAASNLRSDAFLLVYDITNENSLRALDDYMEMIHMEAEQRVEDNFRLRKELGPSAQGLDVGMPAPIIMLAGNKCDLKDSRVVSAKDGLEYARQHGGGFMETSAREMVNIEETFALLVRRVVEARRAHYAKTHPIGHLSTKRAKPATAGQTQQIPEKDSGIRRAFKRGGGESETGKPSVWKRLCCF